MDSHSISWFLSGLSLGFIVQCAIHAFVLTLNHRNRYTLSDKDWNNQRGIFEDEGPE